ncbi:helix-turn-helix domain-containing protein [Candidatus Contubernalis alkaliaceticus]|uniref:helix-turn-helix domain-containing protein n=1 Tax=Candidatus Contubernalis alkaliaceticus TaxID=338645 RepID=UPI001F4BEEE8|nr:helix-turn-helix transcriptional regulator [Candidatus Contubernalis alkalaceticus]UNC93413.1 helix-turn-helix transcriptional regulator [Candidatus Contubernalis alkalaceticus]
MSLLLGKRIRGLRRLKCFTQKNMADRLGISVSMLSNIERGKKYPNIELLKKMTEILQVPQEELFVLPEMQQMKRVNG